MFTEENGFTKTSGRLPTVTTLRLTDDESALMRELDALLDADFPANADCANYAEGDPIELKTMLSISYRKQLGVLREIVQVVTQKTSAEATVRAAFVLAGVLATMTLDAKARNMVQAILDGDMPSDEALAKALDLQKPALYNEFDYIAELEASRNEPQ